MLHKIVIFPFLYKQHPFFYYVKGFHNPLPFVFHGDRQRQPFFLQESGGLKVYGLLSREVRAFMIAPLLWGLTSTDAESSSA